MVIGRLRARRVISLLALLALALFLVWRFIRPMEIFVVEEKFAWPIDTRQAPAILKTLSAEECATCHQAFYDEWRTSIHSQAWTDPYFQADWQFEGSRHVCRLCHTPLDRQQPHKVLDYRDASKWRPVLEVNPGFDARLQHEGVTCAACHLRDGKIRGVFGDTQAPHPVSKLDNPNRVCVRCHVVSGERWDTFFRFPPCGTVAEIQTASGEAIGSGELTVTEIAKLGCVDCHMPLKERPLVAGGQVRQTRQHLWRGGHDPEMVKRSLSIDLQRVAGADGDEPYYKLGLTNTGAAHYVPTGTPDRHFTVSWRLLDKDNKIVNEDHYLLKRTVLWRPFIVDLWDTRLRPGEPREFVIKIRPGTEMLEVEVRYHLLEEKRRRRIGYQNEEPIDYPVFSRRLNITASNAAD